MMRFTVTVVALLASMSAGGQSQTSAEQILDRYIQVTGGAANYQKLQNEAARVEVTVPGTPFRAELVSYSSRSKSYWSLDGRDVSEKQGVQGDTAWAYSDVTGARILEGEEKEHAIRSARLFQTVEWRGAFEKVALAGTEVVDGMECDKVELTPKTGPPEIRVFDKGTGLLVKLYGYTFVNGKRTPMESVFRDYREVDGIRTPFVMESKTSTVAMRFEVKAEAFAKPIPDAVFEAPANVAVLLKAARSATALPNAQTLIDRHLEASGGLDALGGVKTQTIRGQMVFPAANLKGRTTIYVGAEGQQYQIVEMPGVGKIETGNNGDVQWERSAVFGPKITRLASKPGELLMPGTLSQAFWVSLFSKVETVGIDQVGGKPCYQVDATPRAGSEVQHLCYDQSSGLLVRTTAAIAQAGMRASLEITLGDYRQVGSIKAPFHMATRLMEQTFFVDIEEIKFNEDLPAETFKLPGDIQKLADKQRAAAKAPVEKDPGPPTIRRQK